MKTQLAWKPLKDATLIFVCGKESSNLFLPSLPSEKNCRDFNLASASWWNHFWLILGPFLLLSRLNWVILRAAAWSLRFRALVPRSFAPCPGVPDFGRDTSMISAGSVRRSLGLILFLRPTPKKNWPIQFTYRNGGLIDGFAQNGGIPNKSVLSSFTGTAGCAMTLRI